MNVAFWTWIGYIASVVALIGAMWSVINYITIKRLEIRREEFSRYHTVIRQINIDDLSDSGNPFLEMQIAAVYELTLMPKYYDVSLRILNKRLDQMRNLKAPQFEHLQDEIKLSIASIESRKQQRCLRFSVCLWHRK